MKLALCSLAVVVALLFPAAAFGATITVNTTADGFGGPDCGLRNAILSANTDTAVGGCPAGSGADTVVVLAGTYLLERAGAFEDNGQSGDLDVQDTLTLTGPGPAVTTIDAGSTSTTLGGAEDRVFDVHVNRTATIEGVTIRGGRTPNGTPGQNRTGTNGTAPGAPGGDASAPFAGDGEDGGGVRNAGVLTLRNVVVADNTTGRGGDGGTGLGGAGGPGAEGGFGSGGFGGTGGAGGGIASSGILRLEDSVVTGNRTGDGGSGGLGIGGPGGAGASGDFGSGGFGGSGGAGGGVAETGSGELTIVASTISNNVTGSGGLGGSGVGGLGGDGTSGAGGPGDSGLGGSGGSGGSGGGVADADEIRLSTITGNVTGGGARGANGLGGTGGSGAGSGRGGNGGTGLGGSGGGGGRGGGVDGFGAISGSTIAGNLTGSSANGGIGEGGAGGPGGAGGGAGGNGGGGIGGISLGGGDGGGINDSFDVSGSTISGNTTGNGGNGGVGPGGSGGAGGGGGAPGAPGMTFNSNGGRGGDGGGLAGRDSQRTAVNVTIVGNTTGSGGSGAGGAAGGRGGLGAGVWSEAGAIELTHVTVGGGTVGGGGSTGGVPGAGAALANSVLGPMTVKNSILSGDCSGTIGDGANNLQSDGGASPCPGGPGDPLLGPLADNGGPTQTRKPGPGSAALDAVPAAGAGCALTDQRGAVRPGGTACDIGAYEVAPPAASTGPAENIGATSARLTATIEPRGLATGFRFEFGTTMAYGNLTAVQTTPASGDAVQVSAEVTGLAPNTEHHFRVVATGPDGATTGVDGTFRTLDPDAPTLAARLSRRRFAVGPQPTPLTAAQRRVPRGTTIRLTLDEPATVTIAVQRRITGLRVRRRGRTRCVKATPRRIRRAPRRARCKRFVRAGPSLTRRGVAGANAVAFSGRIGRRKLRIGPHRFVIGAIDAAGNRSPARRLGFTIVRARRLRSVETASRPTAQTPGLPLRDTR